MPCKPAPVLHVLRSAKYGLFDLAPLRHRERSGLIFTPHTPVLMSQARLVSILEALGQGMNQQLPVPYVTATVDTRPPSYNPLVSPPGLPPHNPTSLAQLHQTSARPLPMQSTSSALMSQMLEPFGALELGGQSSPVYGMADPGLPYLPEVYQAPGNPHMGPLALPPEHIAAWQAAWLQQPPSAALNPFQG